MHPFRLALAFALQVSFAVVSALGADAASAGVLRYHCIAASPQVNYGLRQVERAAAKSGFKLEPPALGAEALRIERADGARGPEAYALVRDGDRLVIRGGGDSGLLYGLLDVAEQLGRGTPLEAIQPHEERPAVGFRAIKFNLPWAAYRNAPSLEIHQDVCRDPRFWEQFLDTMAANRFNVLTLWSLHPFHYFVVPKSFPEAASLPEAELNEFRALWTKVFAMAKERGIETYLINWNVFVSPGFARAHHLAEYSIDGDFFGAAETSPLVEAYTRECIQQVIDEYPDLTGLGITQGERMGGMTPAQRRAWVDRAIVPGLQAAKRKAKFIYRAPLSANTGSGGTTSEQTDRESRAHIEAISRVVEGPVYVEFKYNWSHGHSSPELFIVHGGKLSDAYWNPLPETHRVVWTVRNEDFHVLRWGGSDFVRSFLAHNLAPHVGGVIVGSEVFIPAKDIVSVDGPQRTWRYDFQRQWLFYATWGRMLFNPDNGETALVGMLADRFGRERAPALHAAWKSASRVPNLFASFVQGTWDGSLYTEAFGKWRDRANAHEGIQLVDVRALITHPVLDKKYLNIAQFVAAGEQVPAGKVSPLALADELAAISTDLDARLKALRAGTVSLPLDAELADLEAWSAFSAYFAQKVRAAVSLARFERSGDVAQKQEAVAGLRRALAHWKTLAECGARYNHRDVLFQTIPPFSWTRMIPQVERDIELAERTEARR